MKYPQPVVLSAAQNPSARATANSPVDSSASPRNDGFLGLVCRVALCFSLPLLGLLPSTRAAAPVDLGRDLGYLRVHSYSADEQAVTAALGSGRALVLDLRGAVADQPNVRTLRAALAGRSDQPPLFVLVGPLTPSDLAEVLAVAPGKFVTLGVREAVPAPQVAVRQSAGDDARAYEALESGLPLADLISGKIEKARYDEAALMNDFRNGNTDAQPPAPPDPTAKKEAKPARAPVLIDRVLQRAVHLHRALLALQPRG